MRGLSPRRTLAASGRLRAAQCVAPHPNERVVTSPAERLVVCPAQGTLDNINLFSCITIISFFLLLPVALLTEGVRFTPSAIRAAGLAPSVVMKQAILAAVCFHAYQQAWPLRCCITVCRGCRLSPHLIVSHCKGRRPTISCRECRRHSCGLLMCFYEQLANNLYGPSPLQGMPGHGRLSRSAETQSRQACFAITPLQLLLACAAVSRHPISAGVVHDPPARVAGHALHRQLPEARHRHRGVGAGLPQPHVTAEHDRCVLTSYD